MNRRDFLKRSTAASVPLMFNGLPVFATSQTGNTIFDYLAQTTYGCGKVLVIIQQNGGNDGLNTIVPIDKYQHLANARSNILIPSANLLPLTNNATTGMNPAMSELSNMYNNGKVCIVQGVSYPNPNFSHFRATDIWFSAASSNQYLDTGWLGRALDTNYPVYPQNYPNPTMTDPLAIQIGSTLPFSLQGPAVNMGYNVSNPAALLNVINTTTDPAPNNDYGRELTFLRLMKDQSNAYAGRITSSYNAQATLSSAYPLSGNTLADQLKIVARLIGGGLKTPVYIVNHPFTHDTHENQVALQSNNLSVLSKAINAFQNDIEMMGKGSQVTGMTFSEFGRRIISNASSGTDHGTSAPVLFFGAAVNGGMIGTSPNIPLNATVSDQIPMQYDFRQLYATVMQHWLCLTPSESQTVLGSNFSTIPIFQNVALPLDGVVLTGQYFRGQSKLTCKVLMNTKYRYYNLQFSTDGKNFSSLETQFNNSLNDQETYVYSHTVAAPKMYYRIAAEDLQGKLDYSNIILFRANDAKQLVRVFPNPVVNFQIQVELFEQAKGPVDISIYDLVGGKVFYDRFENAGRLISFRVPASFSRETHYILEVKYEQTTAREQIIFK